MRIAGKENLEMKDIKDITIKFKTKTTLNKWHKI